MPSLLPWLREHYLHTIIQRDATSQSLSIIICNSTRTQVHFSRYFTFEVPPFNSTLNFSCTMLEGNIDFFAPLLWFFFFFICNYSAADIFTFKTCDQYIKCIVKIKPDNMTFTMASSTSNSIILYIFMHSEYFGFWHSVFDFTYSEFRMYFTLMLNLLFLFFFIE